MDKQIAAIAIIAVIVIIANTVVFLSGIYVDHSQEKFNEYAFNISEPSLKFISSSFVHQNEKHISENLVGFGFGAIIFIFFAKKLKNPLLWFSVLFLLGILLVPIDMIISKLVNGIGAGYGFSNVAIVFVGFAFAVIPTMITQLFQRFIKIEKKAVEVFEKDLTVVFSLLWIFYLLIYSVGKFTNFVHVINGAIGFVIGYKKAFN